MVKERFFRWLVRQEEYRLLLDRAAASAGVQTAEVVANIRDFWLRLEKLSPKQIALLKRIGG